MIYSEEICSTILSTISFSVYSPIYVLFYLIKFFTSAGFGYRKPYFKKQNKKFTRATNPNKIIKHKIIVAVTDIKLNDFIFFTKLKIIQMIPDVSAVNNVIVGVNLLFILSLCFAPS